MDRICFFMPYLYHRNTIRVEGSFTLASVERGMVTQKYRRRIAEEGDLSWKYLKRTQHHDFEPPRYLPLERV